MSERYNHILSDGSCDDLIESILKLVSERSALLDHRQFARLVGRLMSHMTFNQGTVAEMIRVLGPADFQDFCNMVPNACNTRAREG